MAEKLWFIYDSGFPIYVFQSKKEAQTAFKEIEYEYDPESLEIESVFLEDLEEYEDDYKEEYDLAMNEGLL